MAEAVVVIVKGNAYVGEGLIADRPWCYSIHINVLVFFFFFFRILFVSHNLYLSKLLKQVLERLLTGGQSSAD